MSLVIKVRHTGPYVIDLTTGDVQTVDDDGNPIEIPLGKPGLTLCRCGASKRKPFGDSTHKTLHFYELAPPAAPLPPQPLGSG